MAFAKLARDQNGKIVRVNKKSLKSMVQECQLALQQLASGCDDDDDHDFSGELDVSQDSESASSIYNTDTAEIYSLLKSRFECDDFKKKLENAQALVPQNMAVEGSSWHMVSKRELWGGGTVDLKTEDYVFVRQEDVIEGIASFMAAYLVSSEQTKDLAPNELQRALRKTFSSKKKSKLWKAWEGGKAIYNAASWGATAIGMYQNPALLCAASTALRTSSCIMSKLF